MNFKIIQKSKIFLSLAVVVVIASWVAIFSLGLQPGIDLEGGTQWRLTFDEAQLSVDELNAFVANEFETEGTVKKTGEEDFIIETATLDEETHQEYKGFLEEEYGSITEKSFSSVGPTIGQELRDKSIWAMFGVLIGIFLFVAWAFRKVSYPISSWKYGIVALLTLVHDVSIPAAAFAILGHLYGVEVGTTFIVAILVVLGFSVNDTIVVFDRIRENLKIDRGKKKDMLKIINNSVNETLMRSFNTSLTLTLVLVALLILGPVSLYYFILTILIGTIAGTYSSIFVASPGLYFWKGK